jgi:hypothetical protein
MVADSRKEKSQWSGMWSHNRYEEYPAEWIKEGGTYKSKLLIELFVTGSTFKKRPLGCTDLS